jgi:hypothetical protein
METKQLIIDIELPIGTEFWIMLNNEPVIGIISSYKIHVTSATEDTERLGGWASALWYRFIHNIHKDVWVKYFTYEAHLLGTGIKGKVEKLTERRIGFPIEESWYFESYENFRKPKIYFSKEELQKAVFDGNSKRS